MNAQGFRAFDSWLNHIEVLVINQLVTLNTFIKILEKAHKKARRNTVTDS